MASNVFGNPITNSTLEGMPEYAGKTITRTDRAHVAMNMKNSANKDTNVRTYVENLKSQWGTGVSALCVLYNATGDTITLVNTHDFYGHIGPAPYPVSIANGQWGGYLHVKPTAAAIGSTALVVYRGNNEAGDDCDWMAAWSVPWNTEPNRVYTEIREAGHFDDKTGIIEGLLYASGDYHNDNWSKCKSSVIIGTSTSPIYEGIFTLDGA